MDDASRDRLAKKPRVEQEQAEPPKLSSFEEAKKRFVKFVDDYMYSGIPDLAEHSKEILDLFHQWPKLAATAFEIDIGSWRSSEIIYSLPLFFLMKSGLTIVEEIYKLFPPALETVFDRFGETMLHMAGEYGAADEVIEFFAEKSPAMLQKKTKNSGVLPIQNLFNNSDYKDKIPPLKTIKRLVELYPESLGHIDDSGDCCLNDAMQIIGESPETVNYILEETISTNMVKTFRLSPGDKLNANTAAVLSRLLPSLTTLECCYYSVSCTSEGVETLFKSLTQNTTILNLKLSNFISDTNQSRNLMQEFLANNNTVECLKVSDHKPSLTGVLCENREHLPDSVEIAWCKVSSENVRQLLSPDSSIQKLTLHECTLCGPWEPPESNDTCPLKTFAFTGDVESLKDAPCLFTFLASLPSLLDLDLTWDFDCDVTDHVIYLLQRNPQIKTLRFNFKSRVDYAKLYDVLKVHMNLKSLHAYPVEDDKEQNAYLERVLAEHNTTLENVCKRFDSNKQIVYYLALNRHGRKSALDPNTPLPDFVSLLAAVVENNEDQEDKEPLAKFNVLHGLLHENPKIWCY